MPHSEATGTSLPAGPCLQLVLAAGQDGAEASPSGDKAPFTAPASHAPSSASASCHQLALLPGVTAGGGGLGWGLTLPVQLLEQGELPLLHVLSPIPAPAPPAVPSQVSCRNVVVVSQHSDGKSRSSWDLAVWFSLT